MSARQLRHSKTTSFRTSQAPWGIAKVTRKYTVHAHDSVGKALRQVGLPDEAVLEFVSLLLGKIEAWLMYGHKRYGSKKLWSVHQAWEVRAAPGLLWERNEPGWAAHDWSRAFHIVLSPCVQQKLALERQTSFFDNPFRRDHVPEQLGLPDPERIREHPDSKDPFKTTSQLTVASLQWVSSRNPLAQVLGIRPRWQRALNFVDAWVDRTATANSPSDPKRLPPLLQNYGSGATYWQMTSLFDPNLRTDLRTAIHDEKVREAERSKEYPKRIDFSDDDAVSYEAFAPCLEEARKMTPARQAFDIVCSRQSYPALAPLPPQLPPIHISFDRPVTSTSHRRPDLRRSLTSTSQVNLSRPTNFSNGHRFHNAPELDTDAVSGECYGYAGPSLAVDKVGREEWKGYQVQCRSTFEELR